ncbi:MAG: outer membrane beta-barrel protein [Sphingobium sp.]
MSMRAGKTSVLLCLCIGGFPAVATAQERRLDISADIYTQYDSNLARTNKDNASLRGLHRSDVTVTPSINADILYPVGRHQFSLSGGIGYDIHARNSQLDRERIGLDGGALLAISRCSANITAGITRRQSDLGEIGALGGNEIRSVKNTETVFTSNADVSCGNSFGLRPFVTAGYQTAQNSNILRQRTDRHMLSYGGGIGYVHPTIGNMRLFINRSETRYDNQIIPGIGKNGYDMTSYGASFERMIGSRLTGSVFLSWTDLSSRLPGASDFSGFNWGVDLTGKINERLVVHGGLSRNIASTLAVDSNYHVDTMYQFDTSYALTSRLTAKAGITHAPRRFYGSNADFGPLLSRDKQTMIFANLTFARSDRLRFILDYAHDIRNANGDFYDYTNDHVGLRVSLTL